jgi:hypothetical protein
MRNLLAHGDVLVVETEDDTVLGTAEVVGDTLVVRSGYRGHPTVLALADVERITPVGEHEDIEGHAEI